MRTCTRVHGRRLPLGSRGVVLIFAVASSAPTAQSQAPAAASRAANVASDPDVLGAERLFSAWMDGQIAYRGLPGIVVGVVSDQQLVWARGFGYAAFVSSNAALGGRFRKPAHTTARTYNHTVKIWPNDARAIAR